MKQKHIPTIDEIAYARFFLGMQAKFDKTLVIDVEKFIEDSKKENKEDFDSEVLRYKQFVKTGRS
jgi:hypothetical protein